MKVYHAKTKKLSGTDFREVQKKALSFYKTISNKTKRRPYVRSRYFNKQKIFLDLFWNHYFNQSNPRDRLRRIRYFPVAIELIIQNKIEPISKQNPNKKGEILHRFAGITGEKEIFFVQIKENRKNSQKFFISVFPAK